MLSSNIAVYIGSEQSEGFSGFISEGSWFGVLKTTAGLSKEDAIGFLKKLAVESEQNTIESLDQFESFLAQQWEKANLPAHFSCAIGYQSKNTFFLKTIGAGEIYLRRSGDFAKVIGEDNVASGFIEEGDFVIFTTNDFSRTIDEVGTLKDFIGQKNPKNVVEELTPHLKQKEDAGLIALFVSFGKREEDSVVATEQETTSPQPSAFGDLSGRLSSIITNVRQYIQTRDKKQNRMLVVVSVLLIVFVWSVILGYQRRTGAQNKDKIKTTRELVEEKLNQAEDVAFLNLPRAIALINDAKKDLTTLKKDIKNDKNKDVIQLATLIAEKEKSILKKEVKTAVEYFDLSVENKSANGSKLYLTQDTLVVLDPRGEIYLLSLSEKSLEKKTFPEIKESSLVGLDKDTIFFYKENSGIATIQPDKKPKNVIRKDKDWGEIRDLVIFNANLYLLDTGKSNIYKYLVTEDGFSKKTSYFKSGEKPNTRISSFAIDGSVYVAATNTIFKYIEGVRDDFDTVFPEEGVSLNKVMTNESLEKVYAWDKGKGAMYVIAKTGTYERQIKVPILKKASDVVVFKNEAYILTGAKIYQVNLD